MAPQARLARSIRCIPIAASTASFSIDGGCQEMTMSLVVPANERSPLMLAALKVLAVTLAGAWLASCKTTETAETVPYPYDYKQRHPITIQEGKRTVELFVGKHQTSLTFDQRFSVEAFANNWHRDATGSIDIRVSSRGGYDRAVVS